MEVANFIIAFVALLLALAGIVPLLQMLYGRPKLKFEADEFTGPDGKILLVAIKNEKIASQFLRKLGVKRDIGDVLAFFDIQEQGTGRFIAKDVSALLHCAPTRESSLLARARPGFTVGVTVVNSQNNKTWIVDARAEEQKIIEEGDYTARVQIICGEQVYSIGRRFKVGNAPHKTNWI